MSVAVCRETAIHAAPEGGCAEHRTDRCLVVLPDYVDMLEELVDDQRERIIELERAFRTLGVEVNRGASM